MPRGKKYNSAEKHFLEKDQKYRRRITELETAQKETLLQVRDLESQLQAEKKKNAEMQQCMDKLLKYTQLSEADLKKAVEGDKALANLTTLFGSYRQVLRF